MERINIEINRSQLDPFIKATNQVPDTIMGWNNVHGSFKVSIYIEAPIQDNIAKVIFLAGYLHAQLIKQN